MARMHGSQVRCYFGARDVSDEIGRIEINATAETHDRTVFASAGWRAFGPGLKGWEGSLDGFYDNAAAQLGAELETLLGVSTNPPAVLSAYDGNADGVGDRGILTGPTAVTRMGEPISVGSLVLIRAGLRGVGSLGMNAVLLHPVGAESAGANGTGVDNGASTPNGGRGTVHQLGATGTGGTVKVQHSTDGSSWADLIASFPVAGSGAGADSVEVAGTVNRHLRAVWAINASSSLTFVVGFARYP